MKRILLVLLILVCSFSLVACYLIDTQKYETYEPRENIRKIEIVKVGDYIYRREMHVGYNYDVLCEVEDVDAFLNDINGKSCYTHKGHSLIKNGTVAIHIEYTDNKHELLTDDERIVFRDGGRFILEFKHVLSIPDYEMLIDKYFVEE